MKTITLSLVWLTIRIDVIPTALRRGPWTPPPISSPDPELVSLLRKKLNRHLLRDIGMDRERQD